MAGDNTMEDKYNLANILKGGIKMEANPYYLQDTEGNYYNQYPEFQVWEDGKKAGIKEVVEWIKEKAHYSVTKDGYTLDERDWQAKLKDWGIK